MSRPGNADGSTIVDIQVARILLAVGAVQVNTETPFVYTSGIRSPIYCDLRALMNCPLERAQLVDLLTAKIAETCDIGGIDVIAGVATSGIPWAAWVAEKLGKRMAYVRAAPQGHGKGQQVEGGVSDGDIVVVIEDHISTGASAFSVVETLREKRKAQVRHCFSIFTYESPRAQDLFERSGVRLVSLSGISTLLEVGTLSGDFARDEQQSVLAWLEKDPMASAR